ncbi:putative extracellular elastinolytic metalloproteinase precursor [Moniliophthora roreri]|nr:putative extracellular elastinolytic metalloproteinase precursor [Moniliophthora roreri]
MTAFNQLFVTVLLAVAFAAQGNAVPWPAHRQYSTHRVRSVGRGLTVTNFHPKTNFTTFESGIELPPFFVEPTIEERTVFFIKTQLALDSTHLVFRSGFNTEHTQFGYVKQLHDGIPFANAVANVAFKDNRVVAFGHSFVGIDNIADSKPTIPVESVIPDAEVALNGKKNDIEPTLEYLVLQDGTVALVHVFQVENEVAGLWYEAYVDAHSGTILSVNDFGSDASYKVVPIQKQTITEGLETLVDPQNLFSSPGGWHSNDTFDTSGNNVIVYWASQSNTTPQSSSGFNFIYTYDQSLDPHDGENTDASRTNVFYLINSYHDTLYLYGFTESAYNFQNDNFGKGGLGNDRVLFAVQDGNGSNNARFFTPPDGQSGTCRIFLWNRTDPRRDGGMQNDVPIHEMTHGLTKRLTGGGTARCLLTLEASGMGEGWSDAVADWFSHTDTPEVHDFVVGQWLAGNDAGLRDYPYSTDASINPLRYSSVAVLDEVHDIGEVWANILHNVYAALVTEHGWSPVARTNADGTEGNVAFLRLLVDSLSLQPCEPTMPVARDAWIQADQNRYGGVHRCLLWRTFASRGLGVGAIDHVDSGEVPDDC